MPKTRTRLTRPKKPKKSTSKSKECADPSGPTEREWESMKVFRTFVVKDDEKKQYQFMTGKTAFILPTDVEPGTEADDCDFWIGKIKDIRARGDDPSEVWVRVQWYWSPEEVAEKVRSFDATKCSKYERLLSNSYDFVHSSCFDGLIDVMKYDEQDLEQRPIRPESFFYRYTYDCHKGIIKPSAEGKCICNKPYDPVEDEFMHMCVRKGCRKWYHRDCLLKRNWVATPLAGSSHMRAQLFEKTLPDDSPEIPTIKLSRGHPGKDGLQNSDLSYSDIPKELLTLARSPIARGAGMESVVGNAASVIEARRIVCAATRADNPELVPEYWKERVSISGLSASRRIIEDVNLLCPECGGPV
ncbi:hypothetical protein BD410DRAFT_893925 [Rickenella mellea]|uniref:BAH domain-containing protein n=1 Tax=Rickenella mellea TaxID=50990 RepID=A0A4Y7QK41_9AGAM|nr:hypothetical protein BD410DRAFT_893925 [Rickenella mellea]